MLILQCRQQREELPWLLAVVSPSALLSSRRPRRILIYQLASGIGLIVVRALADKGEWNIHLVDINEQEGHKIASSLPHAVFHKADVTNYGELSGAFKNVFQSEGNRLDFVFANAGVVEKQNFLKRSETGVDPPLEPEWSTIDINLKAGINTVHVARHYLLQSPEKGSIVVTGSVSSIWPGYFAPLYTASKCELAPYLVRMYQVC